MCGQTTLAGKGDATSASTLNVIIKDVLSDIVQVSVFGMNGSNLLSKRPVLHASYSHGVTILLHNHDTNKETFNMTSQFQARPSQYMDGGISWERSD